MLVIDVHRISDFEQRCLKSGGLAQSKMLQQPPGLGLSLLLDHQQRYCLLLIIRRVIIGQELCLVRRSQAIDVQNRYLM